MKLTQIGHWSFIGGLVLAILAGFINFALMPLILFILGLIVGFLNVTEKESTSFLVATIALLMGGMVGLQFGGETLASILSSFTAFVSAAALVVALKQIIITARPG